MSPLLLSALLACAVDTLPPETDLQPLSAGRWELGAALLVEDEGGLELRVAGQTLSVGERLLEPPARSASGRQVALAVRGHGPERSVLQVLDLSAPSPAPRVLVTEGDPGRLAISEDGERVVYVGGATGIASVWWVPFQGGEPQQLTNVGLEHQPRALGQPPHGFIPPPHRAPLQLRDGVVSWRSELGEHRVELP